MSTQLNLVLSSRAHESGSEAFHTKKQLVDGVLEEEESHSQEVLGEEDRQEDGEEDRQEDGREKRGAEVGRHEESVQEAHSEEAGCEEDDLEENDLYKDFCQEARLKEGNLEESDREKARSREASCEETGRQEVSQEGQRIGCGAAADPGSNQAIVQAGSRPQNHGANPQAEENASGEFRR